MELIDLLILGLTLFFLAIWWRSFSVVNGDGAKNLPPGPPGWPLVGNLFQIILERRHFIFVIRDLHNVTKDVMLITVPQLPDFLPILTPLFRKQMKRAKDLRKAQIECLVPLIRNRRAFVERGENPKMEMLSPVGAAYVDSLFTLKAPGRGLLGEEELVTLCSELFVAGIDTSTMVKETLRVHSPAHFTLSHATTEDTELGGYKIPSNVNVEFYIEWMTEDPSLWKDPGIFRPERFIDGDGVNVDMTGTKGKVKMLPFGAGRRTCPGLALGLLHVNLTLARMVQAFKWLPAPNAPPDPTEAFAFTVVMKNPLKAVILPR
ncbi:hypothetical protein D5086_007854 [Populus alba]|uniref:Uncharacterized protein n=1 Tax=Populus alba TaxID=43335 RepID=A0ACC4CFG6_POPAL